MLGEFSGVGAARRLLGQTRQTDTHIARAAHRLRAQEPSRRQLGRQQDMQHARLRGLLQRRRARLRHQVRCVRREKVQVQVVGRHFQG